MQTSLKPQNLRHGDGHSFRGDRGEARPTGVPDACGLYFHTDGSFYRTLPPVCTQLYCVVAPDPALSGQSTAFLQRLSAQSLPPSLHTSFPTRRRQASLLVSPCESSVSRV